MGDDKKKSGADKAKAASGSDSAAASTAAGQSAHCVVVHPLVLLSVVDHFNRVTHTQQKPKRVVGVLLGSMKPGKVLDIANSFAGQFFLSMLEPSHPENLAAAQKVRSKIPFEEDDKDEKVWFVDDDYLSTMYHMFHKVAAREKIVGWYHTGPRLKANDVLIHQLIKQHTLHPVLVVIDVRPRGLGLPTDAYVEVEEVHDDGSPPVRTFEHAPCEIDAEEAEAVGVEHLLRDIKDQTAGTLSQKVTDQLAGLRGLQSSLKDISEYLKAVGNGQLPINHAISELLQNSKNSLVDVMSSELSKSLNVQSNDQLMNVYMGALVRSIVAMHNLIDNKETLRQSEKAADKAAQDKKDASMKEGEKKLEEPAVKTDTPKAA